MEKCETKEGAPPQLLLDIRLSKCTPNVDDNDDDGDDGNDAAARMLTVQTDMVGNGHGIHIHSFDIIIVAQGNEISRLIGHYIFLSGFAAPMMGVSKWVWSVDDGWRQKIVPKGNLSFDILISDFFFK